MGFLDRLLGREKKSEDMPAEPQMRHEEAEPQGMPEPPAPGMTHEPSTSEGSQEGNQP